MAGNQTNSHQGWEELEQCIKSEQVSARELAQIFEENPEFAQWYKERNACNT